MRDAEILAQCLVEGDPARVSRAHWLRRKALLISIGVDGMILAALLLAPLASPETLSRRLDRSPAPPFRGVTRLETRAAPAHDANPAHHTIHATALYQPPRIPTTSPDATIPDERESSFSSSASTAPIGSGDGPGVPFGGDSMPLASQPLPPVIVPPRPRPVHVSEGVQTALLEHRVIPVYPPLAIQTRTQGEVRLHAIIAANGTLQSLEVENGNPLLIRAATDAVWQWRYKPAVLNGQPVEVDTFITVIFRLDH